MGIDTTISLVDTYTAAEFLKISSESEYPLVDVLINRASGWANSFTGRILKSHTVTEYQDGTGQSRLNLLQFPVSVLTSIHDDPLRSFGSSTLIAPTDYYLESDAGIVQFLNGAVLSSGNANVKIVYTAGYTPIPYPIQEAVLLHIGHAYRRQYIDQKFGVSSESVGDRSTSYSIDDIPKKATSLLTPYKHEVLFIGV